MSRGLKSLPALLVCSLLLVHVPGALAYFSTTGAGSATTQLPTIAGPSSVTASQSGVNVTVSWSTAALSTGTAVQGYTVTRSDGATVCGSPTLVTTLSCTDSSAPSGTYTYTVKAVYRSWDATATSAPFTVLTAPSITARPSSLSTSSSATFNFSGGNGASYQCQLDGASYSACSSPATYSALAEGPHTFAVRAVGGTSTGPATSYSWTVDTVAPTQTVALAPGAPGAYLNGGTLYYDGNAGGSFKLTDSVSDSGSGPASASFPVLSNPGWSHSAETVTTPSGGPYTSSTFSWTANPANPAGYTVTGADAAGNTSATPLTLTADNAAPAGGALAVNGSSATAAGTTSQTTNSTSFTIGSRTDYTDLGSGIRSSVLTVQSESLTGNSCGAPGSGGPFTTATTITGTTQPSGIAAGYCYLYTLTGIDNVGNAASVSTTVVDNALSFTVSAQVAAATAGSPTAADAIVLTAIKNSVTDTSYTGATLTWSGANNSPIGTTPTLPSNPTWTAGQAAFAITLVKAETETLMVTDGTRSATLAPITVGAGPLANVAWSSVSSPAGTPSPCLLTCTYASGFGNNQTWTASVSITDSLGNVINNIGVGHSVVVTLGGNVKGATTPASPATLTVPSIGPATAATQIQYTSVLHGSYTDTLTATSAGATSATASFSR